MIHNITYKVDLHTHSVASPDGGITEDEYRKSIAKNVVDYIAVTDHNRIDFAVELQKKLGNAIIVGEEIMTLRGEVIGLFLTSVVAPHQSLQDTVDAIHAQSGLVYIPHPFDRLRRGIGEKNLSEIREKIDCIEGFNGRIILSTGNRKAREFGESHGVAQAVGSDAHSVGGLGRAYAVVEGHFTRDTAHALLTSAKLVTEYQPWAGYLSPKWNRIKKLFLGEK